MLSAMLSASRLCKKRDLLRYADKKPETRSRANLLKTRDASLRRLKTRDAKQSKSTKNPRRFATPTKNPRREAEQIYNELDKTDFQAK